MQLHGRLPGLLSVHARRLVSTILQLRKKLNASNGRQLTGTSVVYSLDQYCFDPSKLLRRQLSFRDWIIKRALKDYHREAKAQSGIKAIADFLTF